MKKQVFQRNDRKRGLLGWLKSTLAAHKTYPRSMYPTSGHPDYGYSGSCQATLDPLEPRVLLNAHVFAQFQGEIDPTSNTAPISIVVSPDAGAPAQIQLGFRLRADAASPLNPDTVQLNDNRGNVITPLVASADIAGTTDSVVVAQLGSGVYDLTLTGQTGTQGAFELDIFLVGDADGNGQVDQQDTNLARNSFGAKTGDANYREALDVDFDGRIGSFDVAQQFRNIGARADQATAGTLVTTSLNKRTPFRYTDASGDDVQLKLRGDGSGQARRFADSQGQATGDVVDLVLTGTQSRSSLNIKTKGKRVETGVFDIVVNGSLKTLTAKTTDLGGSVFVTGSLKKMVLDDVAGSHVISIGSAAQTTQFKFDVVSDLQILATGGIKSIKATSWTDSDSTADVIDAAFVGSIKIKGDFGADLQLRGADKRGRSLNRLVVKRSLIGVDLLATRDVGAIVASGIHNSNIMVGLQPGVTGLPASLADIANPNAQIKRLTIRADRNSNQASFTGSRIAAAKLGKVTLKLVDTNNNGNEFGIAAQSIQSIKRSGANNLLRLSGATDPGVIDAQDDFLVRLI